MAFSMVKDPAHRNPRYRALVLPELIARIRAQTKYLGFAPPLCWCRRLAYQYDVGLYFVAKAAVLAGAYAGGWRRLRVHICTVCGGPKRKGNKFCARCHSCLMVAPTRRELRRRLIAPCLLPLGAQASVARKLGCDAAAVCRAAKRDGLKVLKPDRKCRRCGSPGVTHKGYCRACQEARGRLV